MPSRVISSRAYFRTAFESGIKIYEHEKIRLEYLSLSISTDDNTPILTYFERLQPHMLYKQQFGYIDYIGVNVNNQHLHMVIRKPFVLLDILKSAWWNITEKESNIYVKTLKYDMNGKYKYEELLSYIINQEDHHIGQISYYESPSWGIVIHKKRQKKEEQDNKLSQNWRKKSIRYTKEIDDDYIENWNKERTQMSEEFKKKLEEIQK